jgi:hypothetical protein
VTLQKVGGYKLPTFWQREAVVTCAAKKFAALLRLGTSYEVLDDILACLVEQEMGLAEIVARGHAPAIVKKVEHLLYLAEYKRRQAAPGVKISARNFGRDRRYPITNKFREKLGES